MKTLHYLLLPIFMIYNQSTLGMNALAQKQAEVLIPAYKANMAQLDKIYQGYVNMMQSGSITPADKIVSLDKIVKEIGAIKAIIASIAANPNFKRLNPPGSPINTESDIALLESALEGYALAKECKEVITDFDKYQNQLIPTNKDFDSLKAKLLADIAKLEQIKDNENFKTMQLAKSLPISSYLETMKKILTPEKQEDLFSKEYQKNMAQFDTIYNQYLSQMKISKSHDEKIKSLDNIIKQVEAIKATIESMAANPNFKRLNPPGSPINTESDIARLDSALTGYTLAKECMEVITRFDQYQNQLTPSNDSLISTLKDDIEKLKAIDVNESFKGIKQTFNLPLGGYLGQMEYMLRWLVPIKEYLPSITTIINEIVDSDDLYENKKIIIKSAAYSPPPLEKVIKASLAKIDLQIREAENAIDQDLKTYKSALDNALANKRLGIIKERLGEISQNYAAMHASPDTQAKIKTLQKLRTHTFALMITVNSDEDRERWILINKIEKSIKQTTLNLQGILLAQLNERYNALTSSTMGVQFKIMDLGALDQQLIHLQRAILTITGAITTHLNEYTVPKTSELSDKIKQTIAQLETAAGSDLSSEESIKESLEDFKARLEIWQKSWSKKA